MTEQGIGVPTLAQRIAEAFDGNASGELPVPLKTLCRFFSGVWPPTTATDKNSSSTAEPLDARTPAQTAINTPHDPTTTKPLRTFYTSGGYARTICQFAEGLKLNDPIGDLGRALATVYQTDAPVEHEGELTLVQRSAMMPDPESAVKMPAYVMRDVGFCRVRVDDRALTFDGVMVRTDDGTLIMLIDRAFQRTRLGMLSLFGGYAGAMVDGGRAVLLELTK